MRSTRRSFINGALLAPLAARLGAAENRPVFRFGTMTDTHVLETVESCARVKQAFQLFREKGCELIVNTGDIADHFYPKGYAAYRQVFEEVYAGAAERPRQFFVYAGHDDIGYGTSNKRWSDATTVAQAPQAFEAVQKLLNAENGHTCTMDHKGYKFVVFPQYVGFKGFITFAEYEKRIADAVAASPGKPVFVLDHMPAGGVWGGARQSPARTQILSKFPQVVYFCGHFHGSVWNELLVWQGKFTAVHSGCLQNWGEWLVTSQHERHPGYGVLTVDVFPDRLDIRRWDVRDGSEVLPDKPWIVPLPFVEEKAPWRTIVRRAEYAVPKFPAGAELKVTATKPFRGFELKFPSAGPKAYKYKVVASHKDASGEWRQLTWCETMGDWWLRPGERAAELETLFMAPFFTSGDTVRFQIVPVNPFGVAGAPLAWSAEFVVPDDGRRGEVLLDSADPAAELGVYPVRAVGNAARRFKPDADGWYGPFGGDDVAIALPPKLFAGKKGASFRVTFDMESDTPEGALRWRLRLADATGRDSASVKYSTPGGKSGPMRYVMSVTKGARNGRFGNADTYHLILQDGRRCRGKFGRIIIEKMK